MKRSGRRRAAGRVVLLIVCVMVSGLLSSRLLGSGGRSAEEEKTGKGQLAEWAETAADFLLTRFYPQLSGRTAAVQKGTYLDPAYARYVAGHTEPEKAEEPRQVLLLSELNGASDGSGGARAESPAETGPDGSAAETSAAETAAEGEPGSDGPTAVQAAVSQVGAQYSGEQLSDFSFLIDHFYTVHPTAAIYPGQLDGADYLSRDYRFSVDPATPQVLIYHTHYSELYADSDPADLNTGVIGVGNYLAQLLTETYGLNVIHDTTPYEYNSSYSLAGQRVSQILAENPGIKVVIDLHRDAGGSQKLTTEINGKETAKIMFFNGMCQTTDGPLPSLFNPYLSDCLAFSLQMKLVAEADYPGLTRKNYLKAYQYNQHLCPLSTLIEVGTDFNTFEEAKNAMEPLTDILGKVLVKN